MDEHLPLDLLAAGLQDLVSCDGQFYLGCAQCGREARIHYRWLADPASFSEATCASCGAKLESVIRHLYHDGYRCRDNGHHFEQDTARFDPPSCPACGSHAVELLASEIVPPFPATFDQVAPPKAQPWGVVLQGDLEQMRGELGLSRNSLDFPSHLLLNVRFCERLRLANDYPPESTGIALLNEQANLWLEHCRQTSSLETGLHALALFEQLGARPEQQDGAHYVIAIASHVLLVRFSEAELAYAGRPALRADAIRHARAGVALAEQEAASQPAKVLGLAQTEVLLSQLLAIGNAGPDEMREAIAVADRALDRNVLSPEGADDVRVNRALVIAQLPGAGANLLDDAIAVLESTVALLTQAGDARSLWHNLFNLAQLYYQRGRLEDAVRALNESAAVVRDQLVGAGSADLLAAQGGEYQGVFENLASVLAETGRAAEALAAYETLRGAVPRLANDEALRTATAVRSIIHVLEEMAPLENSADAPRERVTFLSPDVATELREIRGPLLGAGTVLVYYGWIADRATALLIYAGPDDQTCIDPVQWALPAFPTLALEQSVLRILTGGEEDARTGIPPLLNGYAYADPGPLRNARLTDASHEAFRHLYSPIKERLQALDARRLAISVAGLLSSVSFETISDRERPGWFLANDFEVCYVPSLGIARNMAGVGGPGGTSLLMIGYSGTDLPGVDAEIEAIRMLWPGKCTVLRGAGLNKRTVLAELANDYDFIHFAGHGSFDDVAPLQSAFYFAVGGDETAGDASRLTAGDLLKVKLAKHPVVTLSACSSGITSFAASHCLTGLTGSLLQAGARAIIASRWPVSDDVALDLMRETYWSIAEGSTPFAAFTQAQKSMQATRALEDWGAFSYLGLP